MVGERFEQTVNMPKDAPGIELACSDPRVVTTAIGAPKMKLISPSPQY